MLNSGGGGGGGVLNSGGGGGGLKYIYAIVNIKKMLLKSAPSLNG